MPKGRTIDARMGYTLGHYMCPCGYEIMGNLTLRVKLHNKKCDLSKGVLSVGDFHVEGGKNDAHQVVEGIRGTLVDKLANK
jgi:hypothetical protein